MTRIVVLDDDPTGIQTVHGCLLITQWDEESVRHAFDDDVRQSLDAGMDAHLSKPIDPDLLYDTLCRLLG